MEKHIYQSFSSDYPRGEVIKCTCKIRKGHKSGGGVC